MDTATVEWCFLCDPHRRLRMQQWIQQQWTGVFCAIRIDGCVCNNGDSNSGMVFSARSASTAAYATMATATVEWCFLCDPHRRLRMQQWIQQQWNGVFYAIRV
jgi:hypothetical protein